MDPKSKPQKRIYVYLAGTHHTDTKYPILSYISKSVLHWRVAKDQDWDLCWTDTSVPSERLASMKAYQKINHFPGMFGISRKDYLARNLGKMRDVYSKEYAFFPRTWLIPTQLGAFKTYASSKRCCYIVKPESSSQGRGIYLIRSPNELHPGDRCIVQRYLAHPLLLDGLKFDLRIYVLVTSCDPLRVYIHEEGLARLATEEYAEPDYENMEVAYMHLTNYAVNKHNERFVQNADAEQDEIGHKRSLASVFQLLEEQGHDIDALWQDICSIVVKTLCCIQPNLAHLYKSSQPDDITTGMCFELLGLDIILDQHLRPWLLEVNHSPSFTVDSPLDERVKIAVIGDALKMLGLTQERRKRMTKEKELRNWLGKSLAERRSEREELTMAALEKKDQWENRHLGGYTRIYPLGDNRKYEDFMNTAGKLWESWTCGKPKSPLHSIASSLVSRRPRTASAARAKATDRPVLERLYAGLGESPVRSHQLRPQSSEKGRREPVRVLRDLLEPEVLEESSSSLRPLRGQRGA